LFGVRERSRRLMFTVGCRCLAVDVKVRLLNVKLPTTGIHDLRHTDGSLLLAQGENPGSQRSGEPLRGGRRSCIDGTKVPLNAITQRNHAAPGARGCISGTLSRA